MDVVTANLEIFTEGVGDNAGRYKMTLLGTQGQILDIVGFEPEWLLVKREGDTNRWTMKPASTGPSVDYSLFVSAPVGETNHVQALRPLGFEVGNEFVVGYGMDYSQLYRNLNFIGHVPEFEK